MENGCPPSASVISVRGGFLRRETAREVVYVKWSETLKYGIINFIDIDQFSCEHVGVVLCYCSQTDVFSPIR